MFKILVVEDDRDLNKTVREYLDRNGYESVGCLEANEAYNELYGNIFDLIISACHDNHNAGNDFWRGKRGFFQSVSWAA